MIDRDELKRVMKDRFEVFLPGEVYSDPCHSQPVFAKYPEKIVTTMHTDFRATDYVCKQHICLPLYPGLKRNEQEYVVESLVICIADLLR